MEESRHSAVSGISHHCLRALSFLFFLQGQFPPSARPFSFHNIWRGAVVKASRTLPPSTPAALLSLQATSRCAMALTGVTNRLHTHRHLADSQAVTDNEYMPLLACQLWGNPVWSRSKQLSCWLAHRSSAAEPNSGFIPTWAEVAQMVCYISMIVALSAVDVFSAKRWHHNDQLQYSSLMSFVQEKCPSPSVISSKTHGSNG